jgi:hypothetical protein
MKMVIDSPNNEKENMNFELFFHVQVMLGLATILSLFLSIHNLMKFNQLRDVFIYDFVAMMRCVNGSPPPSPHLYIDLNTKFKFDAFEGSH